MTGLCNFGVFSPCLLGTLRVSEGSFLLWKVCGMKYTLPDFSKCFGKESRDLEVVDVEIFFVVGCLGEVVTTLCVVRNILLVVLTIFGNLLVVVLGRTSGDLLL